MYPSSWRMRAISAFRRDAGMSTRVPLAVTALRIRDSISAIGSVISQPSHLRFGELVNRRAGECTSPAHQIATSPTTLRHPGHVAVKRELAETETAQGELADVGARAAAQPAPVAQANLVLRSFRFFRDLCCRCHKPLALALAR